MALTPQQIQQMDQATGLSQSDISNMDNAVNSQNNGILPQIGNTIHGVANFLAPRTTKMFDQAGQNISGAANKLTGGKIGSPLTQDQAIQNMQSVSDPNNQFKAKMELSKYIPVTGASFVPRAVIGAVRGAINGLSLENPTAGSMAANVIGGAAGEAALPAITSKVLKTGGNVINSVKNINTKPDVVWSKAQQLADKASLDPSTHVDTNTIISKVTAAVKNEMGMRGQLAPDAKKALNQVVSTLTGKPVNGFRTYGASGSLPNDITAIPEISKDMWTPRDLLNAGANLKYDPTSKVSLNQVRTITKRVISDTLNDKVDGMSKLKNLYGFTKTTAPAIRSHALEVALKTVGGGAVTAGVLKGLSMLGGNNGSSTQ